MQEQEDVLIDFEHEMICEPASVGSRFVNYLIDIVGYYLVIFMVAFAGGDRLLQDGGIGRLPVSHGGTNRLLYAV